ncbi:MAG: hypothetical protein GKR94_22165 [Gammaproteobacteria bacterium]|nr:hypothetical protein [Gammaproteobacteria bacterium]
MLNVADISDNYTSFRSGGKFSKDKPIYNAVALDIMRAHYDYMKVDFTIPTEEEIFKFHDDVFAKHGLKGLLDW